MLQQTQVATVLPYFTKWMERFPTVGSLAAADEQEVLSLWQGLGYYRRGRQLQAGARVVAESGWPTSAEEWRRIPGVGRYTAGAIASIALGEATPLVDGNVERVSCRLQASGSVKGAWAWAAENLDLERPGDWNQALMELGATICTFRSPQCGSCPVEDWCEGREAPELYPSPKAKPVVVPLERDVTVCLNGERFGLEQIPEGEWWSGMWRFPAVRIDGARRLGVIRHSVTNHRITMTVWLYVGPREGLRWVGADDVVGLPLPAPQRRALAMAERAFSTGLTSVA